MAQSKKKIKRPKPLTYTKIDNIVLKKWALKVKERDNWICQVCKKDLRDNTRNCHAHHIIPKIIKETRYDIDNGITLCAYHHGGNPRLAAPYSPHQNALWFSNWLKYNKNTIYVKLMNILRNLP